MKKRVMATVGAFMLAIAGCGSDLSTGTGTASSDNNESTEGQVAGIVMTGTTTNAAESDVNAEITKALSGKIEEELNAQMADPEFQAALEAAQNEDGLEKDVRVGLGLRGLSVFIEDEEIPFAGGKMVLNGDVGLKLKFRPGLKIEVVASGEMVSTLEDVARSGDIKGIPYELALNGSNKMSLDGVFSITIKNWKVKEMSANLVSKIVDSNVAATGTIAGRTVTGAVNMVDVGLTIANANILADPDNFAITCTGNIETKIDDRAIALCDLSETCLSCK